jgi:hypothetical protein
MAAEIVTVPMAVHRDAMPMSAVMRGVVTVVMAVMMSEMCKAVPEETVTVAMTAATGDGVALREGNEQKKCRNGRERSCRSHRFDPRQQVDILSASARVIATAGAIKQSA